VIVWLWAAPGPVRTACGVTDSETRARRDAGAVLIAGQATAACVEKATLAIGVSTLTFGYKPTGQAWNARLRDGRVTWAPLACAPQQAAS
jgi:hypothetical protein